MTVDLALALTSLALGIVYMSFGTVSVVGLRRGTDGRRLGDFGLAWLAFAFTCGPHLVNHGVQLLVADRDGGVLDLVAVAAGAPAALVWLVLRIGALRGGRGDRAVTGVPAWLRVLAGLAAVYGVVLVVGLVAELRRSFDFVPVAAPNLFLVVLYALIGWYVLRAQLASHASTGAWSVSGLALTVVFPTLALMHASWVTYVLSGRYAVDTTGFVVDWLAVLAAYSFLWVVRSLHLGAPRDWKVTTGRVPVAVSA